MTALTRQTPNAPAATRVALAVCVALVAGVITAWNPIAGVGLLVAGAYTSIALRGLETALVMWVPSFFISFFVVGNAWLKGGLAVAVIAAGAAVASQPRLLRETFDRYGRVLIILAAVLGWFALSAVWAGEATSAISEWLKVVLCATVFLLVLLGVRTTRDVRWLLLAFVGAGVFSAVLGMMGVSSGPANPDAAAELAAEGRITAWAGDPNVLAASLVATAVLALTLASRPSQRGRWALGLCAVIAVAGMAATQSRGGLIAGAVALIAGLVLFRRQSARVVPVVVACVIVMFGYFATNPDAASRLTESGDAGSGRTELWTVALRGFRDHPIQGIGLNQFRLESSRYVLEPGTLRFVPIISERPVVVHNTYLQYLVETGLVGIALFLALLAACARRQLAAARRFEAQGMTDDGLLARGVLVATLATLAAGLFFSAGVDYKTWLLLALGPVLLHASGRDGALSRGAENR
ncbi:MAG TPA: O-antigen ligase family protein [Thermoleophilaceae bacterium]|nr:O-antigen ligase family protein [Thermoleophilaceae bacterium]